MAIDLKIEREQAGYTQTQLSQLVGITRQCISAYERVKSLPPAKVAKAIAKILKFDWTRFYDDEPSKAEPA